MVAKGDSLVDIVLLHVVVSLVQWPVAAMRQKILTSKPIWMEIEHRLQDIGGSKFGSVIKWVITICIDGHSKVKVVSLQHLRIMVSCFPGKFELKLWILWFLARVLLTTAFTLSTRSSGHADTTSHHIARTGSVSCKSATVALDN